MQFQSKEFQELLRPIKGNEITEQSDEEELNDAESFGTDLSGDSIDFFDGQKPKMKFQPQGAKVNKDS